MNHHRFAILTIIFGLLLIPFHCQEAETQTNFEEKSDLANETTFNNTNHNNSSRDARVLSFLRDLLFPSSQSPNNYNGNGYYQQQQPYEVDYNHKIDKYGEYYNGGSSYPVSASYQTANAGGMGIPGQVFPAAAASPGSVSAGYFPIPSDPSQNYQNQQQDYFTANSQGQGVGQSQSEYIQYLQQQLLQQQLLKQQLQQQQLLAAAQQQQSTSSGLGSGILSSAVSGGILSSLGNLISSIRGGSGTTTSAGSSNTASASVDSSSSSNLLNSLNGISSNEFDPTKLFGKIFDLSSTSVESLVKRMNQFDKLKCIPRVVCETIARRQEEALTALTSTTTTTTSTRSPRLLKDLDEDLNSNGDRDRSGKDARFIKFQGFDTALQQFVR